MLPAEADEKRPEEVLAQISRIVASHGLSAEYLPDIFSVGVQGDDRTYSRVVVLVGPFPGWDALAELSSRISNETPVNKVTFELARRAD